MRKKYTLLITTILIAAFVFTACSNGSTPAGDSGKKETEAASAMTEASGDSSADSAQTKESKSADTAAPEAGDSGSGASDSAAGETAEQTGIMSSFTTTDVDGNTVDQSIFADYKLTMINVWATYCGPCLREMPDLGELAAAYEDKGVRIVGLVSDTLDQKGNIDDSQVEAAKEIISDTGADYLHILPSTDLFGLLSQISSVPTTFFVDSEGRQVGMAQLGSREKDEWVEIIDQALAEVGE